MDDPALPIVEQDRLLLHSVKMLLSQVLARNGKLHQASVLCDTLVRDRLEVFGDRDILYPAAWEQLAWVQQQQEQQPLTDAHSHKLPGERRVTSVFNFRGLRGLQTSQLLNLPSIVCDPDSMILTDNVQ